MITKITGEQPFQVLTNNFSISPSNEGYTLQISADGKQYSNLFTVGAGVTRLVTGVAANSYYRLSGNQSEVSINWMKTCVTEGGGSGTELQPVADFPLNAVEGTVISYTGSSSASGVYQYDGNEWTEVGADIDLSAYWTSAETQSAITVVEDHLFDVEQVTASALTELHDELLEVSARTVDMSAYWTSAETQDAIDEKTKDYVRINGPVLPLEWGIQGNEYPEKVFNAFFTGSPYVYLASVTNVDMYGIVPNWDPFDYDNTFTIDAENKELYVENVPAGLYRILLENTGNDTGSTFFVMPGDTDDETKGIYTHTTEIPGALGAGSTIIVSNSVDASLAYWTVGKDAERMTIKFEEDPNRPGEYNYHYFLTYKPTIDEALSAYTPTSGFSTINGSAITNGGNIVIEGGADVSNYVTSAQVETQIVEKNYITSAATANMVTSTSVSTIWKGTQAEYDAIPTKDPNTFYIIVSN